MYNVCRFSQGNLSTSGCSGNYANVRDERNPFVEDIEQTRDEAKSAYAITFPFANNGRIVFVYVHHGGQIASSKSRIGIVNINLE